MRPAATFFALVPAFALLTGGVARADSAILLGLDKPAADLSRGASVHEIVGVAAIVSLQAIEYRRLYPDQGALRYETGSSNAKPLGALSA